MKIKGIHKLLCDTGEIKKTEYKVSMNKEGALFNKNVFKEIIDNYGEGIYSISALGFDKDGAEIKLSSAISKKIEILKDKKSWNHRLDLSLDEFVDSIIKKVG